MGRLVGAPSRESLVAPAVDLARLTCRGNGDGMRSARRKPSLAGSARNISDVPKRVDLRTRKALTPLRVFGSATNTPPCEGLATPASKRLGRSRPESPSVSVGSIGTPPVSTASVGKLLTPEMRKLMQTTVRGAQSAENRQVVVEALRSAKKRASPATRKMCTSLIRALSITQAPTNATARRSSTSSPVHVRAREDRSQGDHLKDGRRPPPPPPPPRSPPPPPPYADIEMEQKPEAKVLAETEAETRARKTENVGPTEGLEDPKAPENAKIVAPRETAQRADKETAVERPEESTYGGYNFHSAIRNAAAGAVAALGFGAEPVAAAGAQSCTKSVASQEVFSASSSADSSRPRQEQQEGMKRFRGWLHRELQGQEQELKELLEADTGVASDCGTDTVVAGSDDVEGAGRKNSIQATTQDDTIVPPEPMSELRATTITGASGSCSQPNSTMESVSLPASSRATGESNSCSAPAQLRAELGLCRAELHQARAQVQVLHGAVRRRDEQLAASQDEVKRQREATRRRELAGAQATREASSLADEALASAKQAKNWMQTAEDEAHARENVERQHESACAELERARERATTLEKAQAKLKHDHREELQRAVAEKEAEGQAALEGAVNALESAVQLYEEEHRVASEKAVAEAVAGANEQHGRTMAREHAKLQAVHEKALQQERNAAQKELVTLRSNYDLQQEELRDSHEERLEKLRDTQNKQKKQHDDQTAELLEKLQNLQQKYANDTQNTQARHKNEVELIRSITSSSVEDLERKVLEHERVASAAQNQAREVQAQLAAKVSEHRETMRQLGKASADDARRYKTVETQVSQLGKQVETLQQQLEEAKKDAKAAAEKAEHDVRCAAEEAREDAEEKAAVVTAVAGDRALEALAAAEVKIEAARAASADAELQRRRVEGKFEQLRDASAAEAAEAATLRMQLEDSITMLKRRAEEARAGMAEAIALGERGESDREQMQQRIDKEMQEKVALERQLQSLQVAAKEQLKQGGAALAEARNSSVDAANEARKAVVRAEAAEAACAKAQAEVSDQARAAALSEKTAAEATGAILAAERSKHETAISELQAKHAEDMHKFEAKIKDMEEIAADEERELRKTLQQQKNEAIAQREALKTLIATQKQKLVVTVQALAEAELKNKSIREEHAAAVQQMEAQQKQLQGQRESERVDAELKCAALRSDIDSVRSEAALVQTNLKAELSQLRSDCNSQVHAAQDKTEQVKADCRRACDAAAADANVAKEQARSATAAAEETKRRAAVAIADTNDARASADHYRSEIQRIRQAHAMQLDDLQQRLAKHDALRTGAENQRDESKRSCESALADAQQKAERAQTLAAKLAETEQRAAQELAVATSRISQYARETAVLQQRFEGLLESSESKLESLRAEHRHEQERSLDCERQKAAADISAVREECAAKLKQQRAAHFELQQQHKRSLDELQTQKAELMQSHRSAASMMQSKEDELALARSRTATTSNMKERQLAELRDQLDELKAELIEVRGRATTAEATLAQKMNADAGCTLENAGGRGLFELAAREAAAHGTRQQVAKARAESQDEIKRLRAELMKARAEVQHTIAEGAHSRAGNDGNNAGQLKQPEREHLVLLLEQARRDANMGRKAQTELEQLRTRLQRAEERAAESAMTQCAELEQALLRTSSVRQRLRDNDEEHKENGGSGASLGISMSPVEASDSKPFSGNSHPNDMSLTPSRHGISGSAMLPTPPAPRPVDSHVAIAGPYTSDASTEASQQYRVMEQSRSPSNTDPEASESGILLERHSQEDVLSRPAFTELSDSAASDIVVLRRGETTSGRMRTTQPQALAPVSTRAQPNVVGRNPSEIQGPVPVRGVSRPSSKRDSQVAACIAAAMVVGAAAVAASSSASSSRSTAADS